MKRLKKVLLALFGLIALLILFFFIFLNSLTPTYEGEKELDHLQAEVSVHFDDYGIPHIYADDEVDALRTLGYVHAQDRLWQMELLRRAGVGKLSEVFGEITVETDKFFLSLGIDDYNKKTLAKLDRSDRAVVLSEAYLDGVNQFIADGPTPVEFYLTGLEKQPFTLEDIFNAVAYMGFTFNQSSQDIMNTNLLGRLDTTYTNELFDYDVNKEVKIPVHRDTSYTELAAIHQHINRALNQSPVPQIYGSNSWVLGPEKTATGKVLFENDPHIAQAQPSVWYEAHLVTPNYEKYGYYLAGVPFPLLSHDRNMAHGLTMLANDDTNYYYEEEHPTDTTRYRYKEEWRKFEYVTKTIAVKDAEPISFQIKKTHRGPIINNNYANRTRVEGDRLVSMHWLFTHIENKMVHGLYGINHAKNIAEFESALPNIHAPGLNVMYGDAQGNIAWWATAKLYRMPDSTSTKFILDGASGNDDPIAYLDFSENPHSINPPSHYVYSANNQPDSTSGMYLPGYFAKSRYRAGRIVDMMNAKRDGWTTDDMKAMAVDVTLRTSADFLKTCFRELDFDNLSDDQSKFLDVANAWQGTFGLESVAGVFYAKLRSNLHQGIFADEFVSVEEYHAFGRQLKMGRMFDNSGSKWWDDVATKEKTETKTAIINKAFQETWAQLTEELGDDFTKWTWGRIHYLEHDHPMGSVKALRKYFNVGPLPASGTNETLNNMGYRTTEDGKFKVSNIPSTRRIIDFSSIANSMSILPTGQSGNPLSKHYKDQAELYVNGGFRKMMMDEEEIKAQAEDVLIFKPTDY